MDVVFIMYNRRIERGGREGARRLELEGERERPINQPTDQITDQNQPTKRQT